MSRTGKIAKLPVELREELNRELERGVPGRVLAAWLNAHPAAQAVLREFFGGAPVNEQNLSAWRRGGFADWQTRRQFFDQVREVAADGSEFEKVAAGMADHAARLLSAHYALALSQLPSPRAALSGIPAAAHSDPYASLSRLKPLAAITRTVAALCRAEHESTRLKMEQQAFAFALEARSRRPAQAPPRAIPAEREDQPKSSQIKVAGIAPTPASVIVPGSPVSRLPATRERPPAAPSPSRLILTFPPALHFLTAPPVFALVA